MTTMTLARRGIGRLFSLDCLLFFTLFSVFYAPASPAQYAWDTKGAKVDFQEAERQKSEIALSAEPPLKQYLQCARTYRNVYLKDPHYARAADAIYEEGLLYEVMGERFSSPEYYKIAAKRFAFLVRDYGMNRNCPDALLRLGDIYSNHLKDQEAADEAWQRLKTYYATSKAFRRLQQQAKALPKPEEPPTAAAADAMAAAAESVVQNVRYWSTREYTRVLIDMDSAARYQKALLSDPQRIYLDIFKSRLSGDMKNRAFPVEDDLLKQVRMAQNTPDVVRVVLDLSGEGDHTVFELRDPFRIVIDLHRPSEQKAGLRHSPFEAIPRSDETSPAPASRPTARKIPEPRTPTPPSGASNAVASAEPAIKQSLPAAPKAESETSQASKPGAGTPSSVSAAITKTNGPPSITAVKNDAAAAGGGAPVKQPPALAVAEIEPPSAPKQARPAQGPVSAAKTANKAPKAVTPTPASIPKAASPTSKGDRTLTRVLGLKVGRVVIDPGHGGHDLGCVGPGGLLEKDLVLSIALELKRLLEENLDAEVFLTRTDDTFISLEDRTAFANRHRADLFLSIHANSSRYRSASGVETYYLNFARTEAEREVAARENATTLKNVRDLEDLIKKIAQADKSMESRELASMVQKRLYAGIRKIFPAAKDRGVRRAPFVVLIGANMPSVLTEVAFISNPKDERALRKSANQERMAIALCNGIEDYMKTLGSDVAQNKTGHR